MWQSSGKGLKHQDYKGVNKYAYKIALIRSRSRLYVYVKIVT